MADKLKMCMDQLRAVSEWASAVTREPADRFILLAKYARGDDSYPFAYTWAPAKVYFSSTEMQDEQGATLQRLTHEIADRVLGHLADREVRIPGFWARSWTISGKALALAVFPRIPTRRLQLGVHGAAIFSKNLETNPDRPDSTIRHYLATNGSEYFGLGYAKKVRLSDPNPWFQGESLAGLTGRLGLPEPPDPLFGVEWVE